MSEGIKNRFVLQTENAGYIKYSAETEGKIARLRDDMALLLKNYQVDFEIPYDYPDRKLIEVSDHPIVSGYTFVRGIDGAGITVINALSDKGGTLETGNPGASILSIDGTRYSIKYGI